MSFILTDKDYPFGTLLFLITIPINLIFLFGLMFEDMFNDPGLSRLIPIEFVMFNFGITLCALFYVFQNREWSGDCF